MRKSEIESCESSRIQHESLLSVSVVILIRPIIRKLHVDPEILLFQHRYDFLQ
jgi:hypothetical protein